MYSHSKAASKARVRWGWVVIGLGVCVASYEGRADSVVGCPEEGSAEAIETFRTNAVQSLLSGQTSSVSTQIDACFTASVPACLQRVKSYVNRQNSVDSSTLDALAKDEPKKQPPRELLSASDEDMNVELRADVEETAQKLGWPAVRYKSRFSGGFDSQTPSLLMIRVPGDKLNPPVDYDRYLNIPLPADEGEEELNPLPQARSVTPEEFKSESASGKSLPRTFTIVTIQRKKEAAPSKVYFQRYYRSGNGDSKFSPMSPSSVSGCYSCHSSGMREISPLGYHVREGERQLPPLAWKAVKEMNDSMRANAGNVTSDWRGTADPSTGKTQKFLDPEGYGPVIGPVNPLTREQTQDENGNTVTVYPTRTKEFILGKPGQAGCAESRSTVYVTDIFGRAPGRNNIYTLTQDPPVRWEKVRDAMKCASCHNNKYRGALNSGTSFREIDFKILVDQSMPLGWHRNPMDQGDPSKPVQDLLNPNERIALANCLQVEWNQESTQIEAWLKETSCRP